MELSATEKAILEVLTSCSSCGHPRKKFLEELGSRGVDEPMPVIKELCDRELMRFCEPSIRNPQGVYKPFRAAFQALGLIP